MAEGNNQVGLTLAQMLRYTLAGGIGVFTLAFLSQPSLSNLKATGSVPLYLTVSMALGALVYSIHRALFYPVLYLGMLKCVRRRLKLPDAISSNKGKKKKYNSDEENKAPEKLVEVDYERWQRQNCKKMSKVNSQNGLTRVIFYIVLYGRY